MKYTTLTSLNAYLGTSGIDTLLAQLADSAEAMLDTLLGDGIEQKIHTDIFPVGYYSSNPIKEGRVFYLNAINPTAVTSVNGTSAGTINTDYILDGNKLEFASNWNTPTTFPYHFKIIYTAGYGTIPLDITLAVNMIVTALYKGRDMDSIGGYKQDLLQVDFKDAGLIQKILDSNDGHAIQAIVNRYKVHIVLS